MLPPLHIIKCVISLKQVLIHYGDEMNFDELSKGNFFDY